MLFSLRLASTGNCSVRIRKPDRRQMSCALMDGCTVLWSVGHRALPAIYYKSPRYDGKMFKHEKLSFASSQMLKDFTTIFISCNAEIAYLFSIPPLGRLSQQLRKVLALGRLEPAQHLSDRREGDFEITRRRTTCGGSHNLNMYPQEP